MEKNCTRRASSGASTTADGTSIMMPMSIGSASTSARAISAWSMAASRSSIRAIIGNITDSGPSLDAR